MDEDFGVDVEHAVGDLLVLFLVPIPKTPQTAPIVVQVHHVMR